jgi:hypothetical protein
MRRLRKFLVNGLIITAALFFSVCSSPTGGDDPTTVDKTALNAAISAADAAKDGVVVDTTAANVPEGTSWVTQAHMSAFETAIDAAKAVRDDEDATQANVNAIRTALISATTTFTGQKQPGTYIGTVSITSAAVNGLIAPAPGGVPITQSALTAPGGSSYAIQSLAWQPADNPFEPNTAYTAKITLKANPNYKFTGTITPEVDAGTPAAGTIGGGDTAENTLEFTVAFSETGVNKTDLADAISAADAAKSGVVVNTAAANVPAGISWVTQTEMDAFNSAITTARGVYDADDKSQTQIDDAKTSLQNATSAFNNQKKAGTKTSWARTVTSGNGGCDFYDVATDSSGNIYAAGYQEGTGSYGYGNGITAAGTASGDNAVLVKYNASGTAQWAKTVTAGNSSSEFSAVTVDSYGNIYAAGYQKGTGSYDYGNGAAAAGTAVSGNAVLVKYDASGAAQWARTVTEGSDESRFNAVAVDSSGNIYAAGRQYGTGSYNYGNGAVAAGADANDNAVLVKYDASGATQWVKTVTERAANSWFAAVAVDSSGNIYAAGCQYDTASYGYGNGAAAAGAADNGNAVLVKYDASGAAQWAKSVTTGSSFSCFYAVAADSSGIYAAGYQDGTGSYGYGNGITAAGANSGGNAVLVKYDASGAAQWAKTVTEGNSSSEFFAVAADSSGNIYAAGYQEGTGSYGYGNGITATGTATIDSNAVLVKYDPSGTAQWAKTGMEGSDESRFHAVAADSSGNIYAAGYQAGTGSYNYGSEDIAGTAAYNAVLVKYGYAD